MIDELRLVGLGLLFIVITQGQGISSHETPYDVDSTVQSALVYLLTCQNDDGGFGSKPGVGSDLKSSVIAATAIGALPGGSAEFAHTKSKLCEFLLKNRDALYNLSNVEAQIGRYVVAIVAIGLNPYDINGTDYVEMLKGYIKPDGKIGKENYIWDDCWVILGLIASNYSGDLHKSLDNLKSMQTSSGGWSWNGGAAGEDPDTTAIILCTLLAAGEDKNSSAVKKAFEYLRSEQNPDGGFSTLGSNAATDGWVIMALNAALEDPTQWRSGDADVISHITSLQKENGSIWWKKDNEGFSFEWTANAMIALTGGTMPPVIYQSSERW